MAATPAALFSRLQLAAALLEYDNDPDNPDTPTRSAQDSAIFAHLRRNPAARPQVHPRRSDYLGASESGSLGGRESALDTRRSRASKGSIDALRNPFHADTTSDGHEEEDGEEGLEVDLTSWGLDAFIPKDKKSAKAKGKQPAPAVGSTRAAHIPATNNYEPSLTSPRHGLITSKSISLGGDFEALESFAPHERQRRRSFGSPLDLVGMEPSGLPFHHRRRDSQTSQTPPQPMMVPFPSGSIRSPSPGTDQAYGETLAHVHNRTYSSGTMNSRFHVDDLRRSANDLRYDMTSDALGTEKPVEDNPFAIQNPSHTSRFDPKVSSRARSYSNATMGSRVMPENDAFSVVTEDPVVRERRYSTLELLRPKVLVMPSPLQPISMHEQTVLRSKVQDGFERTTDAPLPPGARATRRLSSVSILDAGNAMIASNIFTPTPYADLTLSQKTFRSTLAVPGAVSYQDLNNLPRATEEGEQAVFDPVVKDITVPDVPALDADGKIARPAGKLYGKSLIDDLESRKAQMRSKQRVFTGDQRPSMMARNSSSRISTFIDPESLKARPGLPDKQSSYGSQNAPGANLARHPSVTMKPLITFDGEGGKNVPQPPAATRIPSSRSVFGVDTLWEREMVKLKELQAEEVKQNEIRRKQEEEEAQRKQQKKIRKKRKGKENAQEETVQEQLGVAELPSSSRVSAEPPVLPTIERAPRRAPPKPSDSDVDTSSESEDENAAAAVDTHKQKSEVWTSSSDEDDGPRRTTGVGLRYPNHNRNMSHPPDNDSEEDVPLAAAIHKVRAKFSRHPQDSEDEDKPLSHVLLKAKSVHSRQAADEDDDEPLGIRASRLPMNMADEDDTPLALHPEHQRRTQYQMFAQQQQQQQQMMMQAQLQSNMLMNASMMGSGFFGPPPMMSPMPMMGMPPMSIPSPPPMHDEAKFGLVDRWRRDVVVDKDST